MSAACFPVRCFTCRKPINQLYESYKKQKDAISDDLENHEKFNAIGRILDELKIGRMCCRRMFMTHVDLSHIQQYYPSYPDNVQRIGITTKSAKPKNFTLKNDEDE